MCTGFGVECLPPVPIDYQPGRQADEVTSSARELPERMRRSVGCLTGAADRSVALGGTLSRHTVHTTWCGDAIHSTPQTRENAVGPAYNLPRQAGAKGSSWRYTITTNGPKD